MYTYKYIYIHIYIYTYIYIHVHIYIFFFTIPKPTDKVEKKLFKLVTLHEKLKIFYENTEMKSIYSS